MPKPTTVTTTDPQESLSRAMLQLARSGTSDPLIALAAAILTLPNGSCRILHTVIDRGDGAGMEEIATFVRHLRRQGVLRKRETVDRCLLEVHLSNCKVNWRSVSDTPPASSPLAITGQEPNDLLFLTDAARWAGVSVSTVDRWRRRGQLGTYRAGRKVMVSRQELSDLAAPHLVPGRPNPRKDAQ